jgi:hypothetical protein
MSRVPCWLYVNVLISWLYQGPVYTLSTLGKSDTQMKDTLLDNLLLFGDLMTYHSRTMRTFLVSSHWILGQYVMCRFSESDCFKL